LLSEVQPRHDWRRIKYAIPPATYERQAEIQRRVLSPLWELDSSWDFGGYTVAQFREFWIALGTVCWIHHWVVHSCSIEELALNSTVVVRHRERWEKELSKWSGLSQELLSHIIDDLIYDPSLHGPGKQGDVTYQPFIPLGSGLLALSNSLVMPSNAERNLWTLLSIKRRDLHSRLQTQKEELQLSELSSKLKSVGLRTFGRLHFTYEGQSSDLDLLVPDDREHFGLGCQLKWRTNPDSIKEVNYTDW
jgi:hypothetical protein